jgi:UDP-galactopyranose mutase|tara:strand:+ start:100 stop:435 length:336 start_codon:yes stop_codon:yes gene_type:complete
MTLFNYSELENITIDENFDDSNYSTDVDNALERGYDKSFPIVVDEDNCIIDGNHRFTAFVAENRETELAFCKVTYSDFIDLQCTFIGNREMEYKFNNDDVFFYAEIAKIAK